MRYSYLMSNQAIGTALPVNTRVSTTAFGRGVETGTVTGHGVTTGLGVLLNRVSWDSDGTVSGLRASDLTILP